MSAHINFKEIYKTSFSVFERVKLLRVFGAVLTTSYILNCIVFYFVVAFIFLVSSPSEFGLSMLFDGVSPGIKLTHFISLGIIGVVSFLFFITIKNWAFGSLTGGIFAYTHNREVSLRIASNYGKRFLKRLIMIDIVIGLTFVLAIVVLGTINSILQEVFPQVVNELGTLQLAIKIIVFLFLFIVQTLAIRYAVIDNKTYLISVRKSVNLFKNNILSTLMILFLNTLILILFFVVSVFGFFTLYSLSVLLSNVWSFLGYLLYNMTTIALVAYVILFPLTIGIYIVFAFAVWNKFFERITRSK